MRRIITDSTEWAPIETYLMSKSLKLKHGDELTSMVHNVYKQVQQLSREEVEQRRGRMNKVDELLVKINEGIVVIEEYLLMAKLLG